jgi:hypothetical protein
LGEWTAGGFLGLIDFPFVTRGLDWNTGTQGRVRTIRGLIAIIAVTSASFRIETLCRRSDRASRCGPSGR